MGVVRQFSHDNSLMVSDFFWSNCGFPLLTKVIPLKLLSISVGLRVGWGGEIPLRSPLVLMASSVNNSIYSLRLHVGCVLFSVDHYFD